eukprot:TRINITY_DN34227_c0_g1_i9.p1 TRINITY_DN34227_c0_g1~~TRINITY_DN34227_c0_g1_i9.p1  ORF type:complete len:199 (-),score=32.69 TRINITY_DN34227_c0_g1_i9:505-1101(-)
MAEDSSPLLEDADEDFEDAYQSDAAVNNFGDKNPLESLDLDWLLSERLGQFGRYQKFIYTLVSLPAVLTAMLTLSSVFTTIVPPHRCYVPVCDSPIIPHYKDAETLGFQNYTIPLQSDSTMDSCHRYKEVSNSSCSAKSFDPSSQVPCDRYLFDRSGDMKNTVAMKYNLVCDRKGQEACFHDNPNSNPGWRICHAVCS